MRYVMMTASVVCLAALGIAGCQGLTDFATLNSNRLLWESLQLYHYKYTLQTSCFCVPDFTDPVTIEVLDGVPVALEYANKGDVPADGLFDAYDTIDELFLILEDAVGRAPVTFEAEYDPTYGFPSDVYIDESLQIADEELGFTVSNFEELN